MRGPLKAADMKSTYEYFLRKMQTTLLICLWCWLCVNQGLVFRMNVVVQHITLLSMSQVLQGVACIHYADGAEICMHGVPDVHILQFLICSQGRYAIYAVIIQHDHYKVCAMVCSFIQSLHNNATKYTLILLLFIAIIQSNRNAFSDWCTSFFAHAVWTFFWWSQNHEIIAQFVSLSTFLKLMSSSLWSGKRETTYKK